MTTITSVRESRMCFFVWALGYARLYKYVLRIVSWESGVKVCGATVVGLLLWGHFSWGFFLWECGVMWCDLLGWLVGGSVVLLRW